MRRFLILLTVVLVLLLGIVLSCGREPGQRKFEQGVRFYKGGHFVRAKASFEQSVNRRPGSIENAETYNYLGIVNWRLGQLEEAIDAFEDSRRLNADLIEPTYNLGILMFKADDRFRAAVLLEEAALVDVNDPRPLEFLGYMHRRAGEWAKARRALYDALGRAPHSARVLTALALVELRIEGPDSCIRYLMQALEHHPEYPPALYNLGIVYMDWLEEREKGKGYLREFLGTAAEGSRVREARIHLGLPVKAQPQSDEDDSAPSAVEQRTSQRPEPTDQRGAEALFEQAQAATEDGDDKRALNLYLQAAAQARRDGDTDLRRKVLKASVEAYFDQPRTHFAYARFLEEQDEDPAALEAYKQAAVLSPEWLEAQAALARTARAAGEYDAALIALRKQVELDKENADAIWQLAQLYEEQLELPERALQAYYHFQQSFPGDTRALQAGEKVRDLRMAQEETGAEEGPPPSEEDEEEEELETIQDVREELKEAVRVRRAAHDLPARRLNLRKPRVRNTRAAIQAFNRGTIYHSREDWDRAIYYYRRALENDDTFVQAFYNLGVVYRMNGDLDLAKDAYLNALRLRPDMVNARYNLAIIYWELKQYTAAEEQARKVLEAEPDNAYAHYVLGLIYASDPRTHEAAREHYREFLRLAPDDAAAPMVKQWLSAHEG